MTSTLAAPTFVITTLGCKVNSADSEAIAATLIAHGLRPEMGDAPADVVVVNTCTVTHLGDRSSRQAIQQHRRAAPDALVVATGCYAQVAPQAVAALSAIDLVVPNTAKEGLAATIVQALATHPVPSPRRMPFPVITAPFPVAENPERQLADLLGRTRAQIKVQDGCDNRCTYCIVPTARGASRSRPIADIVAAVQRKEAAGIQEIVLTGIHLGDYHPNAHEDLGDLLAALLRETGIPRIRVSSLEPEDFRLSWLELWRDPRLCRHLHLPLQSGSDMVLRKMARRYSAARYQQIADAADAAIPGLALTTDIIAGFPGESEEDAQLTYALAEKLHFAKMHVFRFSPRDGTAAARMHAQLPDQVKRARAERLLALNAILGQSFRQRHLGQTVEVLWEERRPSGWEGLTDNYLRVTLTDDEQRGLQDLHHHRTLVLLTEITSEGVQGHIVPTENQSNT